MSMAPVTQAWLYWWCHMWHLS